MNTRLTIILIFFISGCSQDQSTIEKHQKQRDKVINVSGDIIAVETDVFLGPLVDLIVVGNYLLAVETMTYNEKAIHLYDKDNFEYVASTGILGKGPNEITRIGLVSADHQNMTIWVPDLGRMVLWEFPLDSAIMDEQYVPAKKIKLESGLFLVNSFDFFNEHIVVGKAITPTDNSSFIMSSAKLDLRTHTIAPFGYVHPEIGGKRMQGWSKLSKKQGIIVFAYTYCDLLTICDLDGNLKYNVYGHNWFNESRKKSYYKKIEFYKDRIIVMYNGENRIKVNDQMQEVATEPTKFLVFDCTGNYLSTIETGCSYKSFCVDEANHRLIAYFDREVPIGYFQLDEL